MVRVVRCGLHLRIAGAIDDDAGGDEGEQHGCQEPVAGRVRRPFGVETTFKSVAVIIDVEIGFLHWLVHDALLCIEGNGTTRSSPAVAAAQSCKSSALAGKASLAIGFEPWILASVAIEIISPLMSAP